ncbi:MAG: hypothetical protein ACYDHH_24120 [Solirubrobacteraceae bacterium]
MPSAWLKSFGDSKRPIRNDWTNEFLRDPVQLLELMTGPAERATKPVMRPGDQFVLHAVGHGHVFAEGRIESGPTWAPARESRWDPKRWPWIYACRVDTWVPLVDRGPRTWVYAERVKGQIQFGRPYAELTRAEHESLVAALRTSRTARKRLA